MDGASGEPLPRVASADVACARALRAGGRTWRRAGAGGADAAVAKKQLTAAALVEALLLAAAVYFTAVGVWLQAAKALAWCAMMHAALRAALRCVCVLTAALRAACRMR
jgi:hypothetical protein